MSVKSNALWRSFAVLTLSIVAMLSVSTPAMAACRPESGLPCTSVIDVNRTTVIQTGARTFAINFVLANGIGFLCNGNGGNVPLPPGCTKDGISYRAEISSNVASVVPGLNCTIFSGTANRAGQVDFGFRVRFEEKNSPKRKTCILRFTLGSSFSGGQQKLTYTLVPDPNPSADE